jgi:hypothetical protein
MFVCGNPKAVFCSILVFQGNLVEKHRSSLLIHFMFCVRHWHFVLLSIVLFNTRECLSKCDFGID